MTIAGDVDAVVKLVRNRLGEPSLWVEPDGYPDSLALCAIDSVYSLQSHYTATVHVLDRYRTYRREQGGDPNKDGALELLAAIQDVGGPAAAADDLFGNRANAPGTKRLKSESLAEAVERLLDIGVETTTHLRSADTSDARRAWRVKGLGPVSWDYLLMLSGVQGVKADSRVRSFVTTAVGESGAVSKERRTRGEGRSGTPRINAARPRPRDLAVPADGPVVMRPARVRTRLPFCPRMLDDGPDDQEIVRAGSVVGEAQLLAPATVISTVAQSRVPSLSIAISRAVYLPGSS